MASYVSRFLWCISLCIFCLNIDIVYGNPISKIGELLDDEISLEDKLEYLNSIKDSYSFSETDIHIISRFFLMNQNDNSTLYEGEEVNEIRTRINEALGLEEELTTNDKKELSAEDMEIKDKIHVCILEIFLREDIDDSVLTQSNISWLTPLIENDLDSSATLSSKIRFLSLKVLIKFNELKYNTDDQVSARTRILHNKVSFNTRFMNTTYEEGEFWDYRDSVETFIFDPVLLNDSGAYNNDEDNNYYKSENKKVLYDYERFLLAHLSNFPITNHLKQLVTRAFFHTQFEKFKPQYIEAMFFLDMEETLLKIISSKISELKLRIQAIDTSIKYLDQVDILHFASFSDSLLKRLEKISSDSEERIELQKKAVEQIKVVQQYMSKHDRIKDFKKVIFSSNISTENKLAYLNSLAQIDSFSFSKKDLCFIQEVFDDENIDIKVKARIASIVICKSKTQDILEVFNPYDIEGIKFLWSKIDYSGAELVDKMFAGHTGLGKILFSFRNLEFIPTTQTIIQQSARFDMASVLINFMRVRSLDPEYDTIRRLAIKASLELLSRTKHFEEYSKAFLEQLQVIASDSTESELLRNIADYILVQVKHSGVELLRNILYQDCKINFLL